MTAPPTTRIPPARTATTAWIVALTGIGSLMAALDTLVVSTALTTIHRDLHASIEQLEWTVNGYNLSFAVLLITGAALGDRFGRRRLYAAGLAIFALASAASALARSVGWLVAARVLQGAGAALVVPVGLTLLSAAFPAERRGAAIGLFSAITGLSVAAGPLVGGAVVQGRAEPMADGADMGERAAGIRLLPLGPAGPALCRPRRQCAHPARDSYRRDHRLPRVDFVPGAGTAADGRLTVRNLWMAARMVRSG